MHLDTPPSPLCKACNLWDVLYEGSQNCATCTQFHVLCKEHESKETKLTIFFHWSQFIHISIKLQFFYNSIYILFGRFWTYISRQYAGHTAHKNAHGHTAGTKVGWMIQNCSFPCFFSQIRCLDFVFNVFSDSWWTNEFPFVHHMSLNGILVK